MASESQSSRSSIDDGPAGALGPAGARRDRLVRWCLPLGLVVLTTLMLGRGIADGGFRHSDCSRHAMDGVFVHDFVADLPGSITHPVDHALAYYAQYPAMGIPLYYPPFFAVVEAGFFAVFGISVFTARLTVLAFGILGVLMTYKLIKEMAGPAVGALAAAAFVSLPNMVFWSRQTMLEMPTAAMILTASYFFYRYAELGYRKSAIWTGLFAAMAVMTKQPAFFIVPAFFVYLLLRGKWRAFTHWQLWVGVGILAAVLVPYFVVSFRVTHFLTKTSKIGISTFAGPGPLHVFQAWAGILGWPGLVCAAIGGLVCVIVGWYRPAHRKLWLLVVLALAFHAESVYLKMGGSRYPLLIMPILVALVPVSWAAVGALRSRVVVAMAAGYVAVLAGYSYVKAMPPVTIGYAEATRAFVAANGDGKFLLFDGRRDGDVVFYVRKEDPSRRIFVLRGSKMLYTFASFRQFSYREFITDPEGLAAFIQEYGIRAIAFSEKEPERVDGRIVPATRPDVAPARLLRSYLRTSVDFDQAKQVRVSAPGSRNDGCEIFIFATTRPSKSTAKSLKVPVPGLQRIVEVPLDGEGEPRIYFCAPPKEKRE